MSMRFGSSRTCFRREKLLRASGAAVVLLKCGASLELRRGGCADLRPETNRKAKTTVAAQAPQRDGPRYRFDYSFCVKKRLEQRRLGEPGGSPRRLLHLDGGACFLELRL